MTNAAASNNCNGSFEFIAARGGRIFKTGASPRSGFGRTWSPDDTANRAACMVDRLARGPRPDVNSPEFKAWQSNLSTVGRRNCVVA